MAVNRNVSGVLLLPLGVVVSHAVTSVLFPGSGVDGPLHGDVDGLLGVAMAAAAVGVVVERSRIRRACATWRPLTAVVLGSQLTVFAVMELVERLSHGMAVGDIANDPAFRWGLVVQFVAAVLSCALLGVTRRIGRRPRPSLVTDRPAAAPWPRVPGPLHRRIAWTPCSRRGPPPLLLTAH